MSDTPTVKIVLELDVRPECAKSMCDALAKAIRTANDPCYRGPYWQTPVLGHRFLDPEARKYVKLECNGIVRHVADIVVSFDHMGCSLVNGGHDDLYDQGFRDKELAEHGLTITPV